jgi:short-subunit dehydrogenase
MTRRILILGGTSGIAVATARVYAAEGAVIGLAGRDAARLEAVAGDLLARGAAAALIEAQGRGSLVVLGSVAGDRGRRKNFVYGAAKAGIAALMEGIAHRFGRPGAPPEIRAVLVKPGPTRTAMTAGMDRTGGTWAEPEEVARVIRRAADKGGPIVYAPGRWRLIMLIICHLPARIFNRLDI